MITRSAPDKDGLVTITFTLPAEVSGPISVVGEFNDWDPYAHPMTIGTDGRHTTTVQVPQGQSYAFRYLREGGAWSDDPEADAYDHRGGIVHVPVAAAH
ncbi:isoamylase early set domain-containing protein [Nonomuraea sp. NPDC050536]|uniref:isoamylase early set domain-containing protein n=1 Tax=Nonomuraea sp. NPDC050536 TaxID=3364366 RepID=UPI0037C79EDB